MVKQTNELWVIHRSETGFIQLGRRRRRCSIILIYDYVSRFILDGHICFLTESTIRSRRMQDIFWRYGLPEGILFVNCNKKNESFTKMLNEFHIVHMEATQFHKQILELKQGCPQQFQFLDSKIFESLQECREAFIKKIWKWNCKPHHNGKIPGKIYVENIKQHIFLERGALEESYLNKLYGKVTETGIVQLFHRLYQVPRNYWGKQVVFRVSSIQSEEIYIYDEEIRKLKYRCPIIGQVEVPYADA